MALQGSFTIYLGANRGRGQATDTDNVNRDLLSGIDKDASVPATFGGFLKVGDVATSSGNFTNFTVSVNWLSLWVAALVDGLGFLTH